MSKFKVGVEVRLMESVPSYEGGYSIGDTGAIINAPLSCENWVKLKGDEDVVCGYLKTSALELVEPKVQVNGGGGGGGGGVSYGGVPVAIYPNPPHKHRDLIIAWANGAEIGYESAGRLSRTKNPSWDPLCTYGVITKTPLEIEIEKLEAKLAKLKGQL